MPFIGQDWRSPGECWVKHKGCWEQKKLLDHGAQFLGFQSSDSSSLDSDSSISDNENGVNYMESENLVNNQSNQEFLNNLTDLSNENEQKQYDEQKSQIQNKILKENAFLLNSAASLKSQFNNDLTSCSRENLNNYLQTASNKNDNLNKLFNHPLIERITNVKTKFDKSNSPEEAEFKITEYNTTIKLTKNTSIQNIISQYERQQTLVNDLKKLKSNRMSLERQSSFDEVKLKSSLKQPFLKSIKQRNLFPSKSTDQSMDLEEQKNQPITSKYNFVKKNFEKLLTPLTQIKQKDEKKSVDTNKIIIHEKQIEKPSKHLIIKQSIRKIDLNTTHQNIIKHLENDISLTNQELSSQLSKQSSILKNKSSNEQLNQQSIINLNPQPYCPIILKHTKEIAGYNLLSDAFLRLDFYNAIRDIRRFNYVCKLLHLLITQNLTSLSGCATKFLFSLLEEIAFQVAGNQQNIHILHTLLRDVQKIMKKYYCWGRPIGSTLLWEQHLRTIEKICEIVKNIEIKPPPKNGKGFRDLPAELIRIVLLQLSDYKDLMSSGQVNDTMKSFLDEQHLWRELCKYHFTNKQIKQFLKDNQQNKNFILERPINEKIKRHGNADNLNWEKVFHSLRKKFGLKEEYADCLFLCRQCRSLFWKQMGHPCKRLEEMNKENSEISSQFISNNNENNSRQNDGQPILERINQQNRPMNPLINNQIDLNRQINNLNRVNNNINNEINRYCPNANCYSMLIPMHLAVMNRSLTINEALAAATINAAHALNCSNRLGSIEQGKQADLLLLDCNDFRHLVYQFGDSRSLIKHVIKKGNII